MHALRVERESIYTVARKKCYGRLRNETNLPLSGKGECRTDLVVGKYAQTRQRRLRGKVVKYWSRQALYKGPCRALKRGSKNRAFTK